ncbi:hypothetical protein EVAR_103551_1 [Eumeta japonica]|uniref:Uncharacterized protein n=1 Tax=Eumeta variegata TaxID=151549 RepID=A0A4C1YK01_EUMVA|nr:hypothetical protein EVAR_103551_1 [Eumeta japonica]
MFGGDHLFKCVVDVTAGSSILLDRMEGWQEVQNLTSSNHNAITFAVSVEGRPDPRFRFGIRFYNTEKARWSKFGIATDIALCE